MPSPEIWVLGVSARPADLPALDTQREREDISKAFWQRLTPGDVHIEWLHEELASPAGPFRADQSTLSGCGVRPSIGVVSGWSPAASRQPSAVALLRTRRRWYHALLRHPRNRRPVVRAGKGWHGFARESESVTGETSEMAQWPPSRIICHVSKRYCWFAAAL